MDILNLDDEDDRRFSEISIREEKNNEEYPKKLVFKNSTIVDITIPVPGVLKIDSKNGGEKTLVFSGGIHGDEKSGVLILDKLVEDIVSGSLDVHHNVILVYGNLRAMAVNDGCGYRCVEPELGSISNLNRCFNQGMFDKPESYAQERANAIMSVTEKLTPGFVEAIDIHQSFKVPDVCEVRGNNDRSQYTYAVVYPKKIKETLNWVYERYSDIVAGAILNNMSKKHTTFAGYLAQSFNANASTFEQGTIGYTDYNTFTPQLLDNIRGKISGGGYLEERLGFDVWEFDGEIIKNTEDFFFLDKDGGKLEEDPVDFLKLDYLNIAKDGDVAHGISENNRLLFSNRNVLLGDRAAVVIRRVETDMIPRP